MFATSKNSKTKIASSLLALLAVCFQANAGQLVENADKDQVTVTISLKEQNALSVKGRRLLTVIPPQPGLLTTRVDSTLGILYFRLTSPSSQAVSVFASDDKGTRYQLLLNPKPVPAQDIVLQPSNSEPQGSLGSSESGQRPISFQKRIKDLMFAMSSPGGLNRSQSVQVNKPIPLWKEGSLTYIERVADNDFIGEIYRLTNTTTADISLVEQELARPDVVAISVAQHTLAPGASTAIYIIRLRQANEQ